MRAPLSPPCAILTYHSLDESGSVLSVAPARFRQQMQALAEMDVDVVPLRDVLSPAILPRSRPAVALTFDDGFHNLYTHALSVLASHRFSATVFLVSDYCGARNDWPTQPRGVTPQPLLRWKEIAEMRAAGWEVGAHTRSHPDLRTLPADALVAEIVGGKHRIEDELGEGVETFAYPYGGYCRAARTIVEEHFELACSTRLGYVGPGCDRWNLERLDCYYLARASHFRRVFHPTGFAYIGARRILRDLRASALGLGAQFLRTGTGGPQ